MTSQLPRAVQLLSLLLCAALRLSAADARPSTQQADALRQQILQANQRLDFATATRLQQELAALEARAGAASTTVLPPDASFFSAPAGSAASAPATTSSFFTAPTAVAPAGPLPKAPAPASPALPPAKTPAAKAPAPATNVAPFIFTPPTASTAPAATTVRPSMPSLTLPPITTPATEEPRPADVPPAVVEIRAASDALSKLEEFRMAESLTTRRSTTLPSDVGRTAPVAPPPVVMSPAFPPGSIPPAPSVSLAGAPDDARRRLDEITRRRTELQVEADRLAKDGVDWEARYAAAKAELARLESQAQDRGRLQTLREEITRLDADAVRLSQELESGRAEQDRRAREALLRLTPPTGLGAPSRDRPMALASLPPQPAASPAQPERKGPPTFQSVGSSKPQRMSSDGNIARTGRSGEDSAVLERDIARLDERRQGLLRELEEVQLKFSLAERELATATRTGVQADIDRWTAERTALDARYKAANDEIQKLANESREKVAALRSAMGGSDPDAVNPGDSVRVIVAEDDTYNGTYRVTRDGTIVVKGLGRVAVGSMSIPEAEAAVKAKLEETQLTKATVTLEFEKKQEGPNISSTEQPTIIYLAGEFITPGPLKIPDGVAPTLITTIIRSGGITPSGDLTRTKLLRIDNGQGAVEEVNVAAILSGNIPPADIALNPGDIIMIPAFAPVVYVTGNVNKPGTLRLFQDETLTAYSAILRAGGFSRFANLKKCTVVRDLGNGEKIQMPLNVKEIQRGLAPDIVLQGKDIVVVPESFFSF